MNKEKVAEKLKRLRGGKSVDEVAKSIGVTPQAIYQYEWGERVPTDEVKIKLAKLYQTTVENIFFTEV